MGHSHGAKVAVVATCALEAANVPVSQLTLFDSPETGPVKPHLFVNSSPLAAPGVGGGQNFVWRFLQELPSISKTPVAVGRQPTGGTFVDNYYSQTGFGAPFGGYAGLGSVVDRLLRPAELYNPAGGLAGDLGAAFPSHGYPPAWYAQASLRNPSAPSDQQNGLSWSPLLHPTTTAALAPAYDQFPQTSTTTPGEYVRRQFEVVTGGATPAENPTVFPLVYGVQLTMGEVTDTGSSMTFTIDGDTPLSAATISFDPYGTDSVADPIGTGLELDVAFTGIDAGETVAVGRVGARHGGPAARDPRPAVVPVRHDGLHDVAVADVGREHVGIGTENGHHQPRRLPKSDALHGWLRQCRQPGAQARLQPDRLGRCDGQRDRDLHAAVRHADGGLAGERSARRRDPLRDAAAGGGHRQPAQVRQGHQPAVTGRGRPPRQAPLDDAARHLVVRDRVGQTAEPAVARRSPGAPGRAGKIP